MKDLVEGACRLIDLDRLIVKALVEWNPSLLAQYIVEFAALKSSIRTILMDNPIVDLPGAENERARAILNIITSGEPLPVEKALAGSTHDQHFDTALTSEQMDSLGSDALYSWFSHFEYAEGLYEAGSLIVSCGSLPRNLHTFVDEARQCFAFQQYNAVASLCRTILEISIKDVAIANALLPRDAENVSHLAAQEPNLNVSLRQICMN